MNLNSKFICILLITVFVSGCGVKYRYEWSDYDKKLYSHYQNPADKEEFAKALKETLDDAVSSNQIPPGIFAEYGFLMQEQGNSLEAIQYYQKEADKWPESKFFMNKMISVAQKLNKKQAVKQEAVSEGGNK